MTYRTRTEGWTFWQHGALLGLYVTALLGFMSFAAFNILILDGLINDSPGDSRAWVLALAVGFVASIQIGWAVAIWTIHRAERPWKLAAISIVPLQLVSLPLGAVAFIELTREPPPPAPIVY